jgi:predicted alpha/beta superfamily hydrolase
MKRQQYFILLIISIFMFGISYAQENEKITFGTRIMLYSKVLKENRQIFISFPVDYKDSQKRFPVLYVLDGSEERLLEYSGLLRYFGVHSYRQNKIPGIIVVCIPNTDRSRDTSIGPTDWDPVGGGANNFLKFISDELIRYIDKNYRTTDYRIISGGSATGTLVLYSLLTKYNYFDAFIAASPVISPEKIIFDKARALFQNCQYLKKFLFISYYEDDYTNTTRNVDQFIKILEHDKPKNFRYEIDIKKGRSHVPDTYFYEGLKTLFKDWKPVLVPEISPGNGILTEGSSVQVKIFSKENKIRYTLDGTEPTRQSYLYEKPITISKPTTVMAKSFRSNLSESDTVTAEFKNKSIISSKRNLSGLESGLNYKYFEKMWYRIPEPVLTEPKKKGIVGSIDLRLREKEQGFATIFEGFIHIKKEGQYYFYLFSSHRGKFYLGKELIILNKCWFAHNHINYETEESSYTMYLKKGFYPIRILYTNPSFPGHEFKVSYKGPGFEKQEIPPEILFH